MSSNKLKPKTGKTARPKKISLTDESTIISSSFHFPKDSVNNLYKDNFTLDSTILSGYFSSNEAEQHDNVSELLNIEEDILNENIDALADGKRVPLVATSKSTKQSFRSNKNQLPLAQKKINQKTSYVSSQKDSNNNHRSQIHKNKEAGTANLIEKRTAGSASTAGGKKICQLTKYFEKLNVNKGANGNKEIKENLITHIKIEKKSFSRSDCLKFVDETHEKILKNLEKDKSKAKNWANLDVSPISEICRRKSIECGDSPVKPVKVMRQIFSPTKKNKENLFSSNRSRGPKKVVIPKIITD